MTESKAVDEDQQIVLAIRPYQDTINLAFHSMTEISEFAMSNATTI
jgi:hypothetical protein